jgi:hypothetical protein
LETSFDSVIVPEVVSKVADTTTVPCPDFTVTKSMGAAAENEIVVLRPPSTLEPSTGDAHDTLGLSTVRTLSESPWLASASPETLSPSASCSAVTAGQAATFLSEGHCLPIAALTAAHKLGRGGVTVGIGFSIFLFVVGAILTFALEVDTGSGFNLNTVGIILMVGGLLGLLVSVLFWSSFSPWSRRRTVAGDAVVEERRIERELP